MSINSEDLGKPSFECKICNYNSKTRHNYDRHMVSARHKQSSEKGEKILSNYSCEKCNYICSDIHKWNIHISTQKHKKRENREKKGENREKKGENEEENVEENVEEITVLSTEIAPKITNDNNTTYECERCNKTYKKYNSYWYHSRRCKIEPTLSVAIINGETTTESEQPRGVLETMLKEFTDISKELLEQNKELKQMIVKSNTVNTQNIINNTNNGTVNNNKFNLNLFLNEECKNAINITDYINSIQLQLEDLEATAELGYANGITKIISDRVKDCGVFQRPFHCMDSKREIVYVKDNNVWEKENSDKPKMRKMITNVIHKNLQQLSKWHEKYPECLDTNNNRSNEYLNIMIEANGGQEREKKEEQILKNILKEVLVEK